MNDTAGIAVIGMDGRFPKANDVRKFWQNIRDGVDCVSDFSAEELEASLGRVAQKSKDYVASRAILDDADKFDAAFFGILPREAELIDPQQRVFLEICWGALEDAGYVPASYPGPIGVFAGCSADTYFLRNLAKDRQFLEDFTESYQVGQYTTLLGMLPDCLATRVAYKLNLTGPSITVQTACSTSLVAIAQAAQALLTYQCDMALAGGVSITFPQQRGTVYQEGGMVSPDGRCRAFDRDARGTVFGGGAGVVLLKRLGDAIADGDHIYATIKGFGLNNDGSAKAGFTAPSSAGQAKAIAIAQEFADAAPESISYIEAHGTGTPLGDPIEFSALNQVFREKTKAVGFCALGTVKRNIGHLDIAAGVAGFISATQSLYHRQLPPALHYREPNPNIDLPNSPFYINRTLSAWPEGASPRRAGVSAFGVGGTNAHVVLEEYIGETSQKDRRPQLLVLSARSAAALERSTCRLAAHLKENADLDLASAAFTLQTGRVAFSHRRAFACTDVADAIRTLDMPAQSTAATTAVSVESNAIVFLFPGQGAQYPGMGSGLYKADQQYRADIDHCADILLERANIDIREVLCPKAGNATLDIQETRFAQPALFVIEYALARLWMRRGVRPMAMLGHSVGEFVAACLAGVFSLEDGLHMIAERARMMQALGPGAMLSVRLSANEVTPLLNGHLSLAAVNSPKLSVVAGPTESIDSLSAELNGRGIVNRRLMTSHAFHSAMMDPIIEPYAKFISQFQLNSPTIPYISGVTGDWITTEDATDPGYWARHFRQPVRFSDGIVRLHSHSKAALLEVGPGRTLCTLARQCIEATTPIAAVASLDDRPDQNTEALSILRATGQLWTAGVEIDWSVLHTKDVRRCSLPTYPFERERYWIEPPLPKLPAAAEDMVTIERTVAETVNAVRVEPSMAAPENTSGMTDRIDRLRKNVFELLGELSGLTLTANDGSRNFLELGFDSLFLTQVTQAIQSKFGVKTTFRQLLGDLSSVNDLAAYLDAKMPADPIAPKPEKVSVATQTLEVAKQPLFAGQSLMESVFREQLEALSRLTAMQMEMLRGNFSAAPAISAPATPKPPTPKPAEPTSAPQTSTTYTPFKPIQQGQTGGLTERQTRYISALTNRYSAKTAGSKRQVQENRQYLADPRVAAGFRSQWKEMVYPLVVNRSSGSRLWDVDGNEYIDILNGYGPIFFGHAPDFVTEAVNEQIKKGFEIGPLPPLAGEVAKLFCDITGMERASFCGTGSEAVMAAIRLARTVTGRSKIVLFAGSYHGNFGEVLAKPITRAGQPATIAAAPGIPPEMVANSVVLNYGSPEALDFIRQHATELAAVLVEPVQSRHPALQPVEFLKSVREITAASETALIFDEVVTGFRCHPGGAQALFGIRADLATYGKVVAGGLPIGVVAGSARFMDALDGGAWQFGDDSYPEVGVTFFAGTFFRHPLALAAAHAVLQRIKSAGPSLQQGLNEKTTWLVGRLNGIFERRGVPTRIEHFASLFYFTFPSDQRFGTLLYYHLREKGIHIQEGFPCFLSLAHTDAELDRVAQMFDESIAEMQDGGVFPPAPQQVSEDGVTNRAAIEVPLTESQLEILLAAQLGPEASCSFNESITLRLRGDLDCDALKKAIAQLVQRHDALRATFDLKRGVQRLHSTVAIDVPFVDLTAKPESERAKHLDRYCQEDSAAPFDLEAGPLFRASLFKVASAEHVLIISVHHIVCDGWSTNVLLDDLSNLYAVNRSGSRPALPESASFLEYVLEQEKWKTSPERKTVEDWWVAQFATPGPVLDLPTDRPREALKSFRGNTIRGKIAAAAYRDIRKFSASQGCTLFATLLCGFEILIHRLSGQEELAVGIPAAGQSLLDGPPLVGHCVNFLPIRTSFEGDPLLRQALLSAKSRLLDAYEHQNYTFGSLVRKLALPRDPSRLPLVEVQFNLERVGSRLQFPELEVEVDPNPKSFVNFDLFLNVVESDEGLALDLDYNADLFDRETVGRWLEHYACLLTGMIDHATKPVSELPLLNESQQKLLLAEGNNTHADYPRDQCLHHLISAQARRTPNSPAVIFEDSALTYGQLENAANQLASYLCGLGVDRNKTVAIYLERSAQMVVAALGILKAGAAYVPLDPAYPADRIAAVVQDANPAAILTQASLASDLQPLGKHLVRLDTDWSAIAKSAAFAGSSDVSPSDLAYVIFTSGSTGRPKGVEIEHRAVVNFLTSMAEQPGLNRDDTLVAVTTLSFDISVLELFLPLSVGGKVIIASREQVSDGSKLLTLIDSSKATVMQATPTTWRLLIEAGWSGRPGFKILCGGEALPRELADQLLARSYAVWNMYGPTETTVWSSALRLSAGAGSVPIGGPIRNTTFYVVDRNLRPVPPGVAGELLIGGEGVARGYTKLTDLTAEKFVADPFSQRPAARLYRTGDRVRKRAKGEFEFLGRLDNQVKVRGFRIETAEVEAAIAQFPKVRECVVTVAQVSQSDKRLVAYVAVHGKFPALSEWRAFLAKNLPDYMVPSAFVHLESLPRTPNGKIDRKKLPSPNDGAIVAQAEYIAPKTETETTLADICARVLSLPRLSVAESLFDVGADSLHMFQIVARAADAGIALTLKQILTHRTVREICGSVESSKGEKPSTSGPSLMPVSRSQYRAKKTSVS